MEILRIHIQLGQTLSLDSPSAGVRMIPFTGFCDSELFKGTVLPGGMDTQVFPSPERGTLSARYMLEGVDREGKPCKLFIDNSAVMQNGRETITFPTIKTDSAALSFLETAFLSGRIEGREEELDIVISSDDTEGRKHILLHRAGIPLHGYLERKTDVPCPLVLMLHGFGGDMSLYPSLFQHLSDELTRLGLATLRFDFNGHGTSGGDFSQMTVWNEVEDAAAFLQYAQTLDFVTDIYVLGHSQGGVVAGLLAGLYPDVVKKLVLLAPAASLKTDAQEGHCMAARYDTWRVPEKVDVGGDHFVGGLYFRMARNLPIYETTARYQGKAMVVFGGRDQVIHLEEAQKYMDGFRDGVFCLYKTLDHGLWGDEKEEMAEKVVAFLTAEQKIASL